MNAIGIVASKKERIQPTVWYQPWRWSKPDILQFDAFGISFVIAYDNQNAASIFARHGVRSAVFGNQAEHIPVGATTVETGESLYQRLLPAAIQKLMKIQSMTRDKSRLALFGDDMQRAEQLIEQLHLSFRDFVLVSNHAQDAAQLAERVMDDYGLPVVHISGNAHVDCDIAVVLSPMELHLPTNTIVFDQYFAHNTMDCQTRINNLGVRLEPKLPIAANTLAVSEALYPNTLPKITSFLLDYDTVKTIDILN